MIDQNEIRRNPVSGATVIVSPKRQKTLEQLRRQEKRDWSRAKAGLVDGEDCPFCEGHEDKTPPEIRVYRGAETEPDKPGWWVRVLPNLYPAVDQSVTAVLQEETKRGPFSTIPAFGYHHVIVETPKHNESLAMVSSEQIREVFSMWRDLIRWTYSDRSTKYCFLFENYGPLAGASQPHSHSQLIALPVIPATLVNEFRGSQRWWEDNKTCFYCAEIEWEMRMRDRIIVETDRFMAWSLFTAKTPYQLVISPKEHQSNFGAISTYHQYSDPLTEFSGLVQNILKRIREVLNDPDYTLYLHTSPANQPEMEHYHWHIQIEPVTAAIAAGFEKGSGTYINPRLPENAAEDLRKVSLAVD